MGPAQGRGCVKQMLSRVLSVALAHERWESFVLFVHEKPLQDTYPNISKAISL